jgi:PAS domain S-box-containing protein
VFDVLKKRCPTYGTHLRVLLGVAVLVCFCVLSQHNYLLFHSVVEISAVVVACAVFVLFWNTRRYLDNGFFLFIGIACLFAGICDLMHVLTYRGMSVIPGAGGDESIQFKTAGRWIAGLSFLAAPLFLRRKLRLTPTLAAYSIVLGLVFWLVLASVLPDYYTEQDGMTFFEHANRGLTFIVFLAAAAVLAARRKDLDARVFGLFLASLIASAGSELASALSGDFAGFLKVLAHLCEVVSLYLIYTALIEVGLTRPMEVLFRNLKQNEETLQRQIAERQQAEQTLRDIETRHRILFESSPDAVMTLAPPSWKFTSCNPAAVKMFNLKDEAESATLSPWELFPEVQPDGRPSAERAAEIIETAMREGSQFFEWTNRRLNGEEFPATVLLTRMELAGQAMLQARVRDISVQKREEEALRESEEWYRTLFVEALDGICQIGRAHV